MRTRQQYLEWLLPQFTSDPAWLDYVSAISDEFVELSANQMGTFDSSGSSGGGLLSDKDTAPEGTVGWQTFPASFNPSSPSSPGGDWEIIPFVEGENSSFLIPSGSTDIFSFLVRWLPNFDAGSRVTITFNYAVLEGSVDNLKLYLGQSGGVGVEVPLEQLDLSTENTVSVELTLDDNFLYFLAFYDSAVSLFIKDVQITTGVGVVTDRTHSVVKAFDLDETASWVLNKMYKSFDFPQVNGLPDELVRRFVRNNTDFNALSGTDLGSRVMFYFFGFGVRFTNLYARKGDYEARVYPWVPQVKLIMYESTPSTIFAEVAESVTSSHLLVMQPNHIIIPGDLLINETNNFVNTYRYAVAVDGNTVTVDELTNATIGDLITINRQPDFATNPDPDNYFKIPWIDVYIKQQYLQDVTITFETLRNFLYSRLPANVCIRNISFDERIDIHRFRMKQVDFNISRGYIFEISISHDPVLVGGDRSDVLVVWSDGSDPAEADIFGTPVESGSYILESVESQNYVVIDYELPETPPVPE